jgi:hypothetical protein
VTLPEPVTLSPARRRKLTIRKILLALLAGLIFTAVSLHDQRYALWIGGGNTGETRGSLILLSCTYFTGTERVINRMWRNADAGTRCPLVTKLGEAGILIERPLGPVPEGPAAAAPAS